MICTDQGVREGIRAKKGKMQSMRSDSWGVHDIVQRTACGRGTKDLKRGSEREREWEGVCVGVCVGE